MPSPFFEYRQMKYCEGLGQKGLSRQDQAMIMDRSEAWVSQTYSLLANLELIEAMKEGLISRTNALKLVKSPERQKIVLPQLRLRYKYTEEQEPLISPCRLERVEKLNEPNILLYDI